MTGLIVFPDLFEACKAGFQLYDQTANCYLVRAKSLNGWLIAYVPLAEKQPHLVSAADCSYVSPESMKNASSVAR